MYVCKLIVMLHVASNNNAGMYGQPASHGAGAGAGGGAKLA